MGLILHVTLAGLWHLVAKHQSNVAVKEYLDVVNI